jgi:hypothetical protein
MTPDYMRQFPRWPEFYGVFAQMCQRSAEEELARTAPLARYGVLIEAVIKDAKNTERRRA